MDQFNLEYESNSDLTLSDDYKVIIKISEASQFQFGCSFCDYTTVDKLNLQLHTQSHTNEKTYNCSHGEHSYAIENNLIKDQKIYSTKDKKIHTSKNLDGYQCSHCYKRFPHRSYLIRHEIIHTGEKPYQCTFCDKCFSQNSYLLQHLQIHTGEKSYQCNQCNKGFAQKAYLVRHKVIHTGKKPYNCNQCEQSFTRKNYLEKHQLKCHTPL